MSADADQPGPAGRNDKTPETTATTMTRSTTTASSNAGLERAGRARRASRPGPGAPSRGARPVKPSEAWRPGRYRPRSGRMGLFLCHIRPLSETDGFQRFGSSQTWRVERWEVA